MGARHRAAKGKLRLRAGNAPSSSMEGNPYEAVFKTAHRSTATAQVFRKSREYLHILMMSRVRLVSRVNFHHRNLGLLHSNTSPKSVFMFFNEPEKPHGPLGYPGMNSISRSNTGADHLLHPGSRGHKLLTCET